jgi:AraC family ethanolamine operon transcriptional activator
VARYDLAVRALALMDASDQEPLALGTLAQRLGTTPRAIQYALKSALGVGPYQYLLDRRLQRVRRELLHHHTTVTAAAFEHSFENLGRFSSQYARLFGERPSDTLRRIRTATVTAGAAA